LEHSSATEERLAAGSGMDKATIREEDEEDGEKGSSASPKIIQETTLEFSFDASLPTLKARELALDWSRDAFGTTAEEDITGVSIWSAALILSRWIIDHRQEFDGKQVCELGSGCGVSGIASYLYTNATRIVLSDLFDHTIRNLEHNVKLNKEVKAAWQKLQSAQHEQRKHTEEEEKTAEPEEEEVEGCSRCGAVQRFTPDNPEGKLMKCGGCRSVSYCSRECQKKAWKKHKADCKAIRARLEQQSQSAVEQAIEVSAIDWARRETWPTKQPRDGATKNGSASFDLLFGSDLVYHQDIVPVLVSAVDGLLSPSGKFVHVASQARHSLVEFKDAMQARGFECHIDVVPDAYKGNPLVNNEAAAELFTLHFNEMSDVYCIYTFSRRDAVAS
jgi:predicted nicotinamide N-methyase